MQNMKPVRQAVHDASESDIRVLVVQTEGPHFSFGSHTVRFKRLVEMRPEGSASSAAIRERNQ
jgi:hypothetical protein